MILHKNGKRLISSRHQPLKKVKQTNQTCVECKYSKSVGEIKDVGQFFHLLHKPNLFSLLYLILHSLHAHRIAQLIEGITAMTSHPLEMQYIKT